MELNKYDLNSEATINPPCGADTPTFRRPTNRPEIADPTIIEGITLLGSFAANGIAPSVMKNAPSNQLALADSLSALLHAEPLNINADAAIANGGTIPAIITAPMIM